MRTWRAELGEQYELEAVLFEFYENEILFSPTHTHIVPIPSNYLFVYCCCCCCCYDSESEWSLLLLLLLLLLLFCCCCCCCCCCCLWVLTLPTFVCPQGVVDGRSRVPWGGTTFGPRPVKLITLQVCPRTESTFKCTVVDNGGWCCGWDSWWFGNTRQNSTPGVGIADIVNSNVSTDTFSTNSFKYDLQAIRNKTLQLPTRTYS